ncbi:competence protein ComEA [Thermoleophilum album]|uniref:Competence protein ComEA n=1 Tax=Thermoleophilum album TaxID=29539 RepID=A0A1H6FU80_THEAL|nr:competence protein ComEA [Thermoleophilum album]
MALVEPPRADRERVCEPAWEEAQPCARASDARVLGLGELGRLEGDQLRRLLAGVLVLAALVVAFVSWQRGGERARRERPVLSVRSSAERASARFAWVHVVGAVRRPGVYRLPDRALVARAVAAAGGADRAADLTALNLAARIEDGQQVVVPRRGAQPAGASAGVPTSPATAGGAGGAGSSAPGARAAAAGGKLSLRTATLEQLEQLDGIGPTLARRILAYRERRGFRSLDELREVEGIGEKRFEALREQLAP